jgi:hypothetical protein
MGCLDTSVVVDIWVVVVSLDEARDIMKPGRRLWLTLGVNLSRDLSKEGRDEAGVLKSPPDTEVCTPVVVDVMLDRPPV